jgi:hypothetical protein
MSAIVVVLACAVAAMVYGYGAAHNVSRPSRRAAWLLAGAGAAAAIALLIAAHPVRQWHEFTRSPTAVAAPDVRNHFLSASGNYRWQFWSSAVDQWRHHPLLGEGAGTFEAWWAQHGHAVAFAQNPHSLYFQALGELGIVGLTIVLGAFGVGLGVGAVRTSSARSARSRATTAALTAAFAAYVVAAGFDWMWQLTAASAVGIALLALLLVEPSEQAVPPARRFRHQPVLAVGAIAACVLVAAAAADVFASNLKLRDSRAAAARGDTAGALAAADAARMLEPWASSPYLQTALVEEDRDALPTALRWVGRALDRNREDWRVWLIKARIETKLGRIRAARRSFDHAASLNPRSPIFIHAEKSSPP